jgi:hypothetical protein
LKINKVIQEVIIMTTDEKFKLISDCLSPSEILEAIKVWLPNDTLDEVYDYIIAVFELNNEPSAPYTEYGLKEVDFH